MPQTDTAGAPEAVLLLNVGSPDAPTPWAVYRYLRQFLMDGRVLDIAPIPRWMLVNLVIAPFRSAPVAKKYRRVWTDRGSPLLASTRALAIRLEAATGRTVRIAMGVGSPSIPEAVAQLRGFARVIVVPLFPHYASATTGSVVAAVSEAFAQGDPTPTLEFRAPFGHERGFLDVLAESVCPHLSDVTHLLCSFHGLPERQVRKLDNQCLTPGCCERPQAARWSCYRAACLDTANGLRARLSGVDVSVSFQSRLGRDPWLGPDTVSELRRLAAEKRRVAVVCPSFVTDCLETLDEIGVEAREDFVKAGGTELVVVPCLNEGEAWVLWLAGWVSRP